MSPRVFGDRWEVLRSLGEGGQAHTFVVRDVQARDGTEFVLKRLKNEKRLGRFMREVKALKSVRSERIPAVVDFRTDDSPAYVVTPYCGRDLPARTEGKPAGLC